MLDFFSSDFIIIFFAMAACFASVLAVALPMIKRVESKERYRSIIKEKRRNLFHQAREEANNYIETDPDKKTEQLSGRDSIAALFKLEQLGVGQKARMIVQQAGYRGPKAPLIYLISQLVLPLIFCLIAGMFISAAEADLSDGLQLTIIMSSALSGFFLPRILVKNTAQKRQEEVQLSFPDALDMILICVQGGIGLESAVNRIAEAIADHSDVLAEELGLLSAELALLGDRKSAFKSFAERVGSGSARSFANAMIQAEQYGTSISQALRVMAEELREIRFAEAERKAAALPPKLTVPMIVFFLPPLFVIILAPAAIGAMSTFN